MRIAKVFGSNDMTDFVTLASFACDRLANPIRLRNSACCEISFHDWFPLLTQFLMN